MHAHVPQHDSSLLFQFIVSECLTSHRELQALLNLIRCATRSEEMISVEVISASLVRLAGSSYETYRLFSNGQHDGVLTKLKNHCAQLSQNEGTLDNDRMMLHLHADQAWLHCSKCLQLVQKNASQISFAAILQTLNQADGYMCSLIEGIKKMIAYFRYDENVIFFILQNSEQLDMFFLDDSVRGLFEEIYPGGLSEVSTFLIEKYSSRGFSHLLSIIHKKINSL